MIRTRRFNEIKIALTSCEGVTAVKCLLWYEIPTYDFADIAEEENLKIDIGSLTLIPDAFNFLNLPSAVTTLTIYGSPKYDLGIHNYLDFDIGKVPSQVKKLNFSYFNIIYSDSSDVNEISLDSFYIDHLYIDQDSVDKINVITSSINNIITDGSDESLTIKKYLLPIDSIKIIGDSDSDNLTDYGTTYVQVSQIPTYSFEDIYHKTKLLKISVASDCRYALDFSILKESISEITISSVSNNIIGFDPALIGVQGRIITYNGLKVRFMSSIGLSSFRIQSLNFNNCEMDPLSDDSYIKFQGNGLNCVNSDDIRQFLTPSNSIVVQKVCDQNVLGVQCISESQIKKYDFTSLDINMKYLLIDLKIDTANSFNFGAVPSYISAITIKSDSLKIITLDIGLFSNCKFDLIIQKLSVKFISSGLLYFTLPSIKFINCQKNPNSIAQSEYIGDTLICENCDDILYYLTPIRKIILTDNCKINIPGQLCISYIADNIDKITSFYDDLTIEISTNSPSHSFNFRNLKSNIKKVSFISEKKNSLYVYFDSISINIESITYSGLNLIISPVGGFFCKSLTFFDCTLDKTNHGTCKYIGCSMNGFNSDDVINYLKPNSPAQKISVTWRCDIYQESIQCLEPEWIPFYDFSTIEISDTINIEMSRTMDRDNAFNFSKVPSSYKNINVVNPTGSSYVFAFRVDELGSVRRLNFQNLQICFVSSTNNKEFALEYIGFTDCSYYSGSNSCEYIGTDYLFNNSPTIGTNIMRPSYVIVRDSCSSDISSSDYKYGHKCITPSEISNFRFNNFRVTKDPFHIIVDTSSITTGFNYLANFPVTGSQITIKSSKTSLDNKYLFVINLGSYGVLSKIELINLKVKFYTPSNCNIISDFIVDNLTVTNCDLDSSTCKTQYTGNLVCINSSGIEDYVSSISTIIIKDECSENIHGEACIVNNQIYGYDFTKVTHESTLTIITDIQTTSCFQFSTYSNNLQYIKTLIIKSSNSSKENSIGLMVDLIPRSITTIEFSDIKINFFRQGNVEINAKILKFKNCNYSSAVDKINFNGDSIECDEISKRNKIDYFLTPFTEIIVIDTDRCPYINGAICVEPGKEREFEFANLFLTTRVTSIKITYNVSEDEKTNSFTISKISSSYVTELVYQGNHNTIIFYIDDLKNNFNVRFSDLDMYFAHSSPQGTISVNSYMYFTNCTVNSGGAKDIVYTNINNIICDAVSAANGVKRYFYSVSSVNVKTSCDGESYSYLCLTPYEINSIDFSLYSGKLNRASSLYIYLYTDCQQYFKLSTLNNLISSLYIKSYSSSIYQQMVFDLSDGIRIPVTFQYLNMVFKTSLGKRVNSINSLTFTDCLFVVSTSDAQTEYIDITTLSSTNNIITAYLTQVTELHINGGTTDYNRFLITNEDDIAEYLSKMSKAKNLLSVYIYSTQLTKPFPLDKIPSNMDQVNVYGTASSNNKFILDYSKVGKQVRNIYFSSCNMEFRCSDYYGQLYTGSLTINNGNLIASHLQDVPKFSGPLSFNNAGSIPNYITPYTDIVVKSSCTGISSPTRCLTPSEVSTYNFQDIKITQDSLTINISTILTDAFDFKKLRDIKILNIQGTNADQSSSVFPLNVSNLGKIREITLNKVSIKFEHNQNKYFYLDKLSLISCSLDSSSPETKFIGLSLSNSLSDSVYNYLTGNIVKNNIIVQEDCSTYMANYLCITPDKVSSYDFSTITPINNKIMINIRANTTQSFAFSSISSSVSVEVISDDGQQHLVGYELMSSSNSGPNEIKFKNLILFFKFSYLRASTTYQIIFDNCNLYEYQESKFIITSPITYIESEVIQNFFKPYKTITLNGPNQCKEKYIFDHFCVDGSYPNNFDLFDLESIIINVNYSMSSSFPFNIYSVKSVTFQKPSGRRDSFQVYIDRDNLNMIQELTINNLSIYILNSNGYCTFKTTLHRLTINNCINANKADIMFVGLLTTTNSDIIRDMIMSSRINKIMISENGCSSIDSIKSSCYSITTSCISNKEIKDFDFSHISSNTLTIESTMDCDTPFNFNETNTITSITLNFNNRKGILDLGALNKVNSVTVNYCSLTLTDSASPKHQYFSLQTLYLSYTIIALDKTKINKIVYFGNIGGSGYGTSSGYTGYNLKGNIISTIDVYSFICYSISEYSTTKCLTLGEIAFYDFEYINKDNDITIILYTNTDAPFNFSKIPYSVNSFNIRSYSGIKNFVFDVSMLGNVRKFSFSGLEIKFISSDNEVRFGSNITQFSFSSCSLGSGSQEMVKFVGSGASYSNSPTIEKHLTPFNKIIIGCGQALLKGEDCIDTINELETYDFQLYDNSLKKLTIAVNTIMDYDLNFDNFSEYFNEIYFTTSKSSITFKFFVSTIESLRKISKVTIENFNIQFITEEDQISFVPQSYLALYNCMLISPIPPVLKYLGELNKLSITSSLDLDYYLKPITSIKLSSSCSSKVTGVACLTGSTIFSYNYLETISNSNSLTITYDTNFVFDSGNPVIDFSKFPPNIKSITYGATPQWPSSTKMNAVLDVSTINNNINDITFNYLNIKFTGDVQTFSTNNGITFNQCNKYSESNEILEFIGPITVDSSSQDIANYLTGIKQIDVMSSCSSSNTAGVKCLTPDNIDNFAFSAISQYHKTFTINLYVDLSKPIKLERISPQQKLDKIIIKSYSSSSTRTIIFDTIFNLDIILEFQYLKINFVSKTKTFGNKFKGLNIVHCSYYKTTSAFVSKYFGKQLTVDSYSSDLGVYLTPYRAIYLSSSSVQSAGNLYVSPTSINSIDYSLFDPNIETLNINAQIDSIEQSFKFMNLPSNIHKIMISGSYQFLFDIAYLSEDIKEVSFTSSRLFFTSRSKVTNFYLDKISFSSCQLGSPQEYDHLTYTGPNLIYDTNSKNVAMFISSVNSIGIISSTSQCQVGELCKTTTDMIYYDFIDFYGKTSIDINLHTDFKGYNFSKYVPSFIKEINIGCSESTKKLFEFDVSTIGHITNLTFQNINIKFIDSSNVFAFDINSISFDSCILSLSTEYLQFIGSDEQIHYTNSELIEQYLTPKTSIQITSLCTSKYYDKFTYCYQASILDQYSLIGFSNTIDTVDIDIEASTLKALNLNSFPENIKNVEIRNKNIGTVDYYTIGYDVDRSTNIQNTTFISLSINFIIGKKAFNVEEITFINCRRDASSKKLLKYRGSGLNCINSDSILSYLTPANIINIKDTCDDNEALNEQCLTDKEVQYSNIDQYIDWSIDTLTFKLFIDLVTNSINFEKLSPRIKNIVINSNDIDTKRIIRLDVSKFDTSSIGSLTFNYLSILFAASDRKKHSIMSHTLTINNCVLSPNNYPKINFKGVELHTDEVFSNYLLPWERIKISGTCTPEQNVLCISDSLDTYLPFISDSISLLKIEILISYTSDSIDWSALPANIKELQIKGSSQSINIPININTFTSSLTSIKFESLSISFQNDQNTATFKNADVTFTSCSKNDTSRQIIKYRGSKMHFVTSHSVEGYLTPITRLKITESTDSYVDGIHSVSLNKFANFDFGQVDYNIKRLVIDVDTSVDDTFNFNLLPSNIKEIEFKGTDNSKSIYFVPEMIPSRITLMKFTDLTINFKSYANIIFFSVNTVEFYNSVYGPDSTYMIYKGISSKFENSQTIYDKIIPQSSNQILVKDQCTSDDENVLCLVPSEIPTFKFASIAPNYKTADIIYYTNAAQAFKLNDLRENLVAFNFKSGNSNKYNIAFDAGYLQNTVTSLTFQNLGVNLLATGTNHFRVDSISFNDCTLNGNPTNLKYSGLLQNLVCENNDAICISLMPSYYSVEVKSNCGSYINGVQCLLESEIPEYEFLVNNNGIRDLSISIQISTRNAFNLTLLPDSITSLTIRGQNPDTIFVFDVSEVKLRLRSMILSNLNLILHDSLNMREFYYDSLTLTNCYLLETTVDKLEFTGNIIHTNSLDVLMLIMPVSSIDVSDTCSKVPGHDCISPADVVTYDFGNITHISNKNKLIITISTSVTTSFDFAKCPTNIKYVEFITSDTTSIINSIGYDVQKIGNVISFKFSYLRIIFYSSTDSFNISDIEFTNCYLNEPNLVSHLEFLGQSISCTNSNEICRFLNPATKLEVRSACSPSSEVHCITPDKVENYDFDPISRYKDHLTINVIDDLVKPFDFTKLRSNILSINVEGLEKEKFLLNIDKLGTINNYSFSLITIKFVSKLERTKITLDNLTFTSCDLDRDDNIKELIYEGDGLICTSSNDVMARLVPISTIEVKNICLDAISAIQCIRSSDVADYDFKFVSLSTDTLSIFIDQDSINSFNFKLLPSNIKKVVIDSKLQTTSKFMFDISQSSSDLSFSISNLSIEFTASTPTIHFKYTDFKLVKCTGDTKLKAVKYDGSNLECDNDQLKALLTPVAQVVVYDDEHCQTFDAQQGINGVACISYKKVETFDFNCLSFRDDLNDLPIIVRNQNLNSTNNLNVFDFNTLPPNIKSITFNSNSGDTTGSIRFNPQMLPSGINKIDFTNLDVTFNSDINFFTLEDSISFTNCKLGQGSNAIKYTWINIKYINSDDIKTHLTPLPSESLKIKETCDEFVEKVQCIPSKYVSIYDFSTINSNTKNITVSVLSNSEGSLDLTKSQLDSIVYEPANINNLTVCFDVSLIGAVENIRFDKLSIIFLNSKGKAKISIRNLEFYNCTLNEKSQNVVAKFVGPYKNIKCENSIEIFDFLDIVLTKLHIIKTCDAFDDTQADSVCVEVDKSNMFDFERYKAGNFEIIVHDDIPKNQAINLSTVTLDSDITIRGFDGNKLQEISKKVSIFLNVEQIRNTKSFLFDNIIIKLYTGKTDEKVVIPVKKITFTSTAELDTTESSGNVKIPDDGVISGNSDAEQFLSTNAVKTDKLGKSGLSQVALIGIIVSVVVVVVVVVVIIVVVVIKKSDCNVIHRDYSDDFGSPIPKSGAQKKLKVAKMPKKKHQSDSDSSFDDISL